MDGMIIEKVTFEQSPEGVRELEIWLDDARRGNHQPKALIRNHAKGDWGSARRLEWSDQGQN